MNEQTLTKEMIRSRRIALGLSLRQFGLCFEPPIPKTNLHRIEQGKHRLTPGMAARTREAFARAEAAYATKIDNAA